ncbi:MAG: hypothetical protein SGI88_03225 [Candidatus Hydrogenedentes bacterium]|nr:hypothetical protein [Candidatus Hydrogenedentota bacterium]
MRNLIFVYTMCCVALQVMGDAGIPDIVHGGYSHPKGFWDTGAKLNEYGLNAVFIHSGGIDEATIHRARAEGCKVFAEFATLNGKVGEYVDKHPDAHPIDDTGNPARAATWFMGVCPTHAGFRQFRMDELRALVKTHDIDGVWMDYLHWHAQFEDPYPVFIKTCFNDSCIAAFEASANVKVLGDTTEAKAQWIFHNAAKQWEDWRVSIIVDWAREIRAIVKEARPNALIGNFQCSWRAEDLGGVLRRCLGLDFDALAAHVDAFSPMIYHGRMGRSPESVKEYVEYFGNRYTVKTAPGEYPRLWPIVQAHDEPRIEPEELEQVLRYGLSGKSSGVLMFTLPSVALDEGKMAAMKRVYTE